MRGNRIASAVNNMKLRRFRQVIQVVAFGVLVYGGYLAINTGNQLPVFACPFAEKGAGTCYFFGFQHQMHIPLRHILSGRGIGIVLGFAAFALPVLVFSKSWCGYACPIGTVQDWISSIRRRLGIRYSVYPDRTFRRLSRIKYVLLALMVLVPLGMSNAIPGMPPLNRDFETPFCMMCPGRTVSPLFRGDAGQLAVDFSSRTKMILTTAGMAVTGIFFLGAFVKRRFFCLFCPMSALHYIFSKVALLKLRKYGEKCTRCGNCYRACDVGIREIAENLEDENIVRSDCMMCFNCVAACPEEDCLKVTFLGMSVFRSTEEGFFKRTGEGGRVDG